MNYECAIKVFTPYKEAFLMKLFGGDICRNTFRALMGRERALFRSNTEVAFFSTAKRLKGFSVTKHLESVCKEEPTLAATSRRLGVNPKTIKRWKNRPEVINEYVLFMDWEKSKND